MEPTHDDVTMDNWTADVTDTNATSDDNAANITTTTTATVDELASSHDNQGERDVTHCFTCHRRRRRRLRVITDQSCCLRFHSHHTLSHLHFSSGFTALISNGGRRT